MSYCVHCGVELAPSEARCPLCQTPVVDPAAPYDPTLPREFPIRSREQRLEINPLTTLSLAAVLLAVPALICLLIDLLANGRLVWSLYPIGAFGMIFLGIIPPVALRKNAFFWSVVVDVGALCLYLWLVQSLSGGTWFQTIVFPVLLLLGRCWWPWPQHSAGNAQGPGHSRDGTVADLRGGAGGRFTDYRNAHRAGSRHLVRLCYDSLRDYFRHAVAGSP